MLPFSCDEATVTQTTTHIDEGADNPTLNR